MSLDAADTSVRATSAGCVRDMRANLRKPISLDRLQQPHAVAVRYIDIAGRVHGNSSRRVQLSVGCGSAIARMTLGPVSCDCGDRAIGRDFANPIVPVIRNIQVACRINSRALRIVSYGLAAGSPAPGAPLSITQGRAFQLAAGVSF